MNRYKQKGREDPIKKEKGRQSDEGRENLMKRDRQKQKWRRRDRQSNKQIGEKQTEVDIVIKRQTDEARVSLRTVQKGRSDKLGRMFSVKTG